jgi:PAS domain-containing protein
MDELLHGNEATALLTNYTKDGRKFFNFLRVGPIVDAANNITHFVGVLQEVTEEPDYYHMAA